MKIFAILIFIFSVTNGVYARSALWLQTTTSVENSGLLPYLLPIFEAETGIKVRVIAVGTGHALNNAKNGDGDVLITHAEELEIPFMNEGYGKSRDLIMTNDFIVVGPKADNAKIGECGDLKIAFQKIMESQALFISRGDNSGTHIRELALWRQYNIDYHQLQNYKETGQGMGRTLMIANESKGYTLADRATWTFYANKDNLKIICENKPPLINNYVVMVVNAKKVPGVDEEKAEIFKNWLLNPRVQQLIGNYRVNNVQLFYPVIKE